MHINSGKRLNSRRRSKTLRQIYRWVERVNVEIKKTSLNKLHQDNKAKFVEFAGYEMPIQYSKGIIEEHKFTRTHSGIFDVSHMGQLFVYGDESLTEELEKIFPLDLKNLKQNSSKYSFLMYEHAGIMMI